MSYIVETTVLISLDFDVSIVELVFNENKVFEGIDGRFVFNRTGVTNSL